MVYKLHVTEHADQLLDRLVYHLIFHLKNQQAKLHGPGVNGQKNACLPQPWKQASPSQPPLKAAVFLLLIAFRLRPIQGPVQLLGSRQNKTPGLYQKDLLPILLHSRYIPQLGVGKG